MKPILLIAAILAATVSALAAADPEPKTHVLFAGVDISVQDQTELHPVEDVQGGSFIVHVNGQETKVAGNWTSVHMKVQSAMKISAAPAQIAKLVFERAYTPENDPFKKFARSQGEESAIMAEWYKVQNEIYFRSVFGGGGSILTPTGIPKKDPFLPTTLAPSPEAHLRMLDNQMRAARTHRASMIGHMEEEIYREEFDAIRIDFDLTSPEPARRPYVVLMMRFHAEGALPDHGQNWFYAAELDHLNEKPARIHLLKGGFPPGYVLESYQIHVFDGQREIATNVSPEQASLTASEAYLMLRTDYLVSHKGGTHEAVAAMGHLSESERQSIGEELYQHPFYVKVTSDGKATATFSDRALTQPAFDAIAKFANRVRYLPALADGKPVDGVAELRFSQLHL